MTEPHGDELEKIIIDLASTGSHAARLAEQLKDVAAKRDQLIRRAYALGLSARAIATAGHVTHGWVIQVAGQNGEPRKQARNQTREVTDFLQDNPIYRVQLTEGRLVLSDGSLGPRGREHDWAGVANSDNDAIDRARAAWRKTFGTPFTGGGVSVERANPPAGLTTNGQRTFAAAPRSRADAAGS